MNKITIVIPYYQQERGILSNSVRSALKQKKIDDFEIIVVDDGSPVPAYEELQPMLMEFPEKIKVIRQENLGPAAARNKGLDNASKDTNFIAFLDSDDQWVDFHLSNAMEGLNNGLDFYFSDFLPLGSTSTHFSRITEIKVQDHRKLDEEGNLYEFKGDFFDQLIRRNIVGTSTAVYRFNLFEKLRFREEFFNCETHLFWLEIAKITQKVVFSIQNECVYGKGVNIWESSGWGSVRALNRCYYSMKAQKKILKLFPLTSDQRKGVRSKIRQIRSDFIKDLLHSWRHNIPIEIRVLLNQLRLDPLSFILFPFVTLSLIFKGWKKLCAA